MRVGSAAAAAVAVLCAAVTAADGAAAAGGGPVLTKGEVQREIDAALAREGTSENTHVLLLVVEKWSHGKPPPECLIERPRPIAASKEQADHVVAGLTGDGWRAGRNAVAAIPGLTTLLKGGWRLELSWLPPGRGESAGELDIFGGRPDC